MNISNESLLKILAVAAVAYFLLSGSSTPEKFMYGNDGLGLVPQHIRQEQPGPGLHIRMREDPFLNAAGGFTGHIRTNPMGGNVMNSQYISHHIRRDRRNNMLNSMMRGTDDIAGVY